MGAQMKRLRQVAIPLLVVLGACSANDKTDAEFGADVVSNMHQFLLGVVLELNHAARDLQTAAPSTAGRGWNESDQASIASMKKNWIRARMAWEQAEGALAPLFPTLDRSIDGLYEEFLASQVDDDLFDARGVTGMHAIERIVYASEIPASVTTNEMALTGYRAAAWPATEAEATEFRTMLCEQLVTDTQTLVDEWQPRAIDLPGVFEGLTALMNDQQEKVKAAANHEEESRYSERTMGDLRDNLVGTRAVYRLFVPWLLAKPYGDTMDVKVQQAFDRLEQTYAGVTGDSIPAPPPSWSSTMPTPDDQQSPFGQLYSSVVLEVDASHADSAAAAMGRVANALGLPPAAAAP
jgi:iron uptake system component EfeO